jgi:hypothetical protein
MDMIVWLKPCTEANAIPGNPEGLSLKIHMQAKPA